MSLHADLLEQAEQLAQLDPRRPKQANLRRAVSSAYYALFHLLTSEASALYAGEPGLASRINRTHNHGEMKKASAMIANDKLPKAVRPPGEGYTTPPDLKQRPKTGLEPSKVVLYHFAQHSVRHGDPLERYGGRYNAPPLASRHRLQTLGT